MVGMTNRSRRNEHQVKTFSTMNRKLEQVLSRMVDAPVEVIGSGRTDAGAHAMGQTATTNNTNT